MQNLLCQRTKVQARYYYLLNTLNSAYVHAYSGINESALMNQGRSCLLSLWINFFNQLLSKELTVKKKIIGS